MLLRWGPSIFRTKSVGVAFWPDGLQGLGGDRSRWPVLSFTEKQRKRSWPEGQGAECTFGQGELTWLWDVHRGICSRNLATLHPLVPPSAIHCKNCLSSVMDDHPVFAWIILVMETSPNWKIKSFYFSLWQFVVHVFMHSIYLFPYEWKFSGQREPKSYSLSFHAVGSALLPGDAPTGISSFRCLRTPACSPESISYPWPTAPVPSLQCCRILNLHPVGSLLGPLHTVRVLGWGGPICLQQPETHIPLALHDPRDLISEPKTVFTLW